MADVSPILNQISGALSGLSTQVINMIPDERTFSEMWNWQQPSVTRHDVSDRIQSTIATIQSVESYELSDPLRQTRLAEMPNTIQYFQSNILPNMPGSNSYFAYESLISLLEAIEGLISDLLPKEVSWDDIEQNKLAPAHVKKRLDTINKGVSNVEKQLGTVKDKIGVISEAYQAANELPASLAGVEAAREQYEVSEANIKKITQVIEKYKAEIEAHKDKIEFYRVQSHEVAAGIQEVYSAATRQGLGKAFQDRANELRVSTYFLMALLFGTLGGGAYLSHERVKVVDKILLNPQLAEHLIWPNVFLAFVSVAAPIWFAWLLTKQIGQRFRLAEDYGFKASVAKAYEGYRREALELGDATLQTRLLEIALNKVEEPPLAHIERDEAASPFHDLITSWRSKKIEETE